MSRSFFKTSVTFFLCFIAAVSVAQVKAPESKTDPKFPDASAFAKSNITYKIISAANKTYGYDILSDNRLLIHQPSVPGASGNEGFKTSASAEKVAKLVITKIKKGEMPPTVTTEEMKTLKVN